ncbi:MAG: 1,4-alpha-glucan branching enzyme GlgB [Myxococcales bacterium]
MQRTAKGGARRTREAAQAPARGPVWWGESPIGDHDRYLFNEGTHVRLWEKLGSHPAVVDGVAGVHFAVWAPNAAEVSVIGPFNGWSKGAHPLRALGESGIWQGFLPGLAKGDHYKYHIASRYRGYAADKADPLAVMQDTPPHTHSVVWDLDYTWGDGDWMASRARTNANDGPISIYEVHLGSWMRVPEDGYRSLSYGELAPRLADWVVERGYTHVELLPVMEHPFFGSWGYQCTGYFAPSSRYGSAQDLMGLIDHLHQRGIGVILDWVPSHFPTDEHGLGYFDGTHLYEHEDPRLGFHPDWNSAIFNYSRAEVQSFLISSALYWVEVFHADGLRVDAVASMLYLDYSRKEGEWIPNEHGGRENLAAIAFLRRLNEVIAEHAPDARMIAEESTSWPMVSRPTYVGGLGFGLKWDMGWMHDTLAYFAQDPVYRKFHHNKLTFRALYAWTESFVLPLSHDEVVHGKGSLISRMPGDDWQRFANLRLLLASMWAQPGKKLLFMGGDVGQWTEWAHDRSIDWQLMDYPRHRGIARLVSDLNRLYRTVPALHELDLEPAGFQWIDANDSLQSVLSYLRLGRDPSDVVAVVINLTPVPRHGYRIGVPAPGYWEELLNTDAAAYEGSGVGNLGGVTATGVPAHGRDHSLELTLPPLGAVLMRPSGS